MFKQIKTNECGLSNFVFLAFYILRMAKLQEEFDTSLSHFNQAIDM